jgi:hypothetical protein
MVFRGMGKDGVGRGKKDGQMLSHFILLEI